MYVVAMDVLCRHFPDNDMSIGDVTEHLQMVIELMKRSAPYADEVQL
jgi:hypothetical protein